MHCALAIMDELAEALSALDEFEALLTHLKVGVGAVLLAAAVFVRA